jgi:hypothetical protein
LDGITRKKVERIFSSKYKETEEQMMLYIENINNSNPSIKRVFFRITKPGRRNRLKL